MQKWILAAALIVACGTSYAGNSNGCQGNCPSDGGGATATGGSATGGNAYAGAAAGAVAGANASVGDVTNVAQGGDGGSSVAFGGAGGRGGDANQEQGQYQRQSQSNIGINGQQQSARSDQSQSSTNTQSTDASSQNDNRSSAAGNTTSTNVSYRTERNAPPVYLGQLTATMSCSGSFNAGSSSQGGSGAFGFTWISGDCRSVVTADKFRELGMVDTSCKILKTTKGFKRAAKANPELADIDCTAK